MARKKRILKAQKYHHIYNRGHNKMKIFLNPLDIRFFLKHLYRYARDFGIYIDSHCIMKNHYHTIMRTGDCPQNLSKMMHAFLTKFSCYFNHKYNHRGAVFQGRYQSREVEDVKDLLNLREYLRNNPVKEKYVQDSDDYKWSRIGGGQTP